MTDLLGPADAGATPTLATTTDVTSPFAGDTWFQDCTGGVSGTGTDIVSKWLNRLMQQMRVAIRMSGVPQSNAFDTMLSWAIQSGYANWINYYTGGVNALVGNSDNNPQAVEAGTIIRGIVTTGGPNTGPVTFNWSGLGAQPVLRLDGSPCVGGEIRNGDRLMLMWDGGSWVIVSPLSPVALTTLVESLIPPPYAYGDIGSIYVGFNDSRGGIGSPAIAGLAGVWSTIQFIPYAWSSGGAYQGTIYVYKRVS